MENQSFQRHVAHKVKIMDIVNAPYHQVEGADPNFLKLGDKEISRMNIIAAIVDKNASESHANVVLDDASGTISGRLFEQLDTLNKVQLGDVVNVVGRPREYNGEKYVLLETIQKVDPRWAKVRSLEIKSVTNGAIIAQPNQGTPPVESVSEEPAEEKVVVEDIGDMSPNGKVLKAIKELDTGDGVAIEDIPVDTSTNVEQVIELLLKEGNIFEIKPGRVKVLE